MTGPHVTNAQAARALERDGTAWQAGPFLRLAGPAMPPPGPLVRLKHWIERRLTMTRLEHVNVTVADPEATAAMLGDLFGWRVRWRGSAIHGGRSLHVGGDAEYLAVYAGPPDRPPQPASDSYGTRGGLNHIDIVVEDLDAVEAKVRARGYTPHSHADYEPGRRFYFREENGIEIEVVSYA